MIANLSSPRGYIVNDGISSELGTVSYASTDDVMDCMLQLGIGTDLVKVDLKNAYSYVTIHPLDQNLLSVK